MGNTTIREALMQLNESTSLNKGIFWIVDEDDINKNKNYCFTIDCDMDGNVIGEYQLNAKSGETYNHKLVWQELPSSMTFNKPYNYYPRGRVEIKNGIAKIFLNPTINYKEITDYITNQFHLYEINGIRNVKIISDGSNHYKCYREDGWKPLNK